MPPEIRVTSQFMKAVKKAVKQREMANVMEALREIATAPETAAGSHPLAYTWAGMRAANCPVVKRNRIIFKACEECVRCGHRVHPKMHKLDCCDELVQPLDRVTFVDYGNYHQSAGSRRHTTRKQYDVIEVDGESPIE